MTRLRPRRSKDGSVPLTPADYATERDPGNNLEAVRREARAHAMRAVRVLAKQCDNDKASASARINAAMKLLEIAFGQDAVKASGGSGSISELLEGLGAAPGD